MIKNLAIRGGGPMGAIAYTGAIKVLEDKGIIKGLVKIAGTSAGAIIACMLTIRYTAEELFDTMSTMDFKKFEDFAYFDILSSRHGLCKGHVLQQWIEEKIASATGKVFATFADLHSMGYPDLYVIATDAQYTTYQVFSYTTTPDVIVSEAVRASMSIPILFDAFSFTKGVSSTDRYIDGGLVFNYPITLFDDETGPNQETLGLFVHDINDHKQPIVIDSIVDYGKAIYESALESQNDAFYSDPSDVSRTIIIDSLGTSPTTFDISPDLRKKLYQSGIGGATNKLKDVQP